MNIKYHLIGFLLCLIGINSLLAQDELTQKYRLADTYEKSGDYKNAGRLYEELHKSSPKRIEYFAGLVRSLKASNQYSYLLPFIEDRLKMYQDVELLSLYGEILWRVGRNSDADKAWSQAVSLSPSNAMTYSTISDVQMMLKLYNKAIETLEAGRVALKSDLAYSDELSQLYIATGDYKSGIIEVMNLFDRTQNLAQTQGRLSAMMINQEAIEHINQSLKTKESNNNDNVNLKRIYAWFLRSTRNYNAAFDMYVKIDNIIKANGNEILRFAVDSQKDSQWDVALKAYEYIIDNIKNRSIMVNALYGFTNTLEQKLNNQKNISDEDVKNIIERYKNISEQYTNTSTAAECLFRISELKYNYLHDTEAAIKQLNSLISKYPDYEITARASILLSTIYISQNKTNEAKKVLNTTINKLSSKAPEQIDNAKYKLAEIEYFNGNIDSAAALFKELSKNTSSDIANDALNKSLLIEINKSYILILKKYAKAEMLELMNSKDEAINLYNEVINSGDDTDLQELSFLKIANIEIQRNNFSIARNNLDSLLTKNPDTIYADYCYLLYGNSFLLESNKEQAIKYYTDLLAKFPRTIYLQDVRNKIRELRGA